MNYFIVPPSINLDVPKFLMKRKVVSSARSIIQWAVAEYFHALDYYRAVGDERSVRLIEKHMSVFYILSKHPDFKRLCMSMDSEVFNSLERKERRLMTDAWNVSHSIH